MTRFLVTGASGLLGLNFSMEAIQSGHSVYGVVNRHGLISAPFEVFQLDLCQSARMNRVIEKVQPDVIVHCAAMAIVDECEKYPERAVRVNAQLPGDLAATCYRSGIQMVHISTDAIFDGEKGDYSEDDQPSPLSTYARTKLEGEHLAMQANPDVLIARINIFGWSITKKRSLAEYFFNHLSAGKKVNGFTDICFCPLLVNDLAKILMKMISLRLNGIYHVVSSECISKYEFGRRVAHYFNLDESLMVPTSWKDGGLLGVRSPNLKVNVGKLTRQLGESPPTVESGLERFHELYLQGYPQRLHLMSEAGTR